MTRSRVYFKSSSFKMALLFTVLLSAAVLSLGYFLYDFGREELELDSEAALDLEIKNILLVTEIERGKSLTTVISERIDSARGIHYRLADIAGNHLAGDIEEIPDDVIRLTEGIIVFEVESIAGKPESIQKVAAKFHTLDDGSQLLVARDVEDLYGRFARLRLLSILSIGCMMTVILVSFLISLFVVRSINRMSNTALEIMETGDLSRRLSVDSRWDDLSHLANVLNEMLSRIEGLLEGVKQVSNDIAHDLRTPLTRLKNRLEDVGSKGAGANEIELIIEEADHILATFNALLRIARIDAGKEKSGFAEIELREILQDVYELYEPMVHEAGSSMEVNLDCDYRIRGDRNLLFQAFVNILDNALKHGGADIQIKIVLREDSHSRIQLEIEDSGIGIGDAEKEKVFERFYRCDLSRSKPGSGLGLSMVTAVVRLHDADIELYDAAIGGLGVRIIFPVSR